MILDRVKKALLVRLADLRFHSGTELAAEFGMTRAAVWKQLSELQTMGLDVTAVPGRGYRATMPLELLDAERIRAELSEPARALLGALDVHDLVDSTNDILLQSSGANRPQGTVCLAEAQTAGRGRQGRTWVSPIGANVYFSLLWRFDESQRVAGLSLAVGVAVMRALERLGLAGIGLKWPNDVLLGERKLGGILVEMSGESHGACTTVIGIGLNRYLARHRGIEIEQAWTDLSQVIPTHRLPSRNLLIAFLLNELLPLLASYAATGLAPWLGEWRRFHRLQGRAATLYLADRAIEGTIEDVTDTGLLILRCKDGICRQFASGEIRLRVEARP